MSARETIAAAAKTVVDCHPYFVAKYAPGTAYVRLDRTEYPNKFGGVDHWHVFVVLPQDLAKAEREFEVIRPRLKAALDPHLVITSVVLQRLEITGVGVLPAAVFQGHREADH